MPARPQKAANKETLRLTGFKRMYIRIVTPIYHAPLIRVTTNPRRNRDSCARMLAAVAVASADTIRLRATRNPTKPVTMVISQEKPAALALKTGDAAVVLSFISLARGRKYVELANDCAFVKLALSRWKDLRE